MSIRIQPGATKNQRLAIARIFYQSFKDKLAIIFGERKKASNLIANLIHEDRILIATREGIPVGFAGLHYQGKNFLKFDFPEIVRIYGLATIRVLIYFLITLLDELQPNQLHVEVLAVTEEQRSKGVGTKLLKSTIDFAKLKKFPQIKIEVINTNPKAKKLYEKIGFEKTKDWKIPYPFHILTGFNIITEMQYNV